MIKVVACAFNIYALLAIVRVSNASESRQFCTPDATRCRAPPNDTR